MSTVQLPESDSTKVSIWTTWWSLRKSPYGITPIGVMALAAFLGGVATEVVAITVPNIAQDLSLDLNTLAGISSAVSVIALAITLGAGWLGDRVSRTKQLGAGLVVQG